MVQIFFKSPLLVLIDCKNYTNKYTDKLKYLKNLKNKL